MLDKFDYAEPNCPLCNGEDFYYPKKDAPLGRIPVERVIRKIDSLFDKNDYTEAGRLLVYWRNEAVALKDKSGELAMENELVGYYRKQNDMENGLASVSRALALTEELGQDDMASGATVFLNCATAYKAFGMADKAMPLYERSEQIYMSTLSAEDARFGGLYNNMALALADLERFEQAENAYFKALGIMESIPTGATEAAITYINLAHMYESCGEEVKIGDCMKSAYELLQSKDIPHDGYYAFVLEKCAPSFGYFGDTEIYERMMREAEEIYARS